jgi:transposase-like protein
MTRRNEPRDPFPPDTGCDWGEAFSSCLACPLSVCRYDCPDDDPDLAYREALTKGLITWKGKPAPRAKRALARTMIEAGTPPIQVADTIDVHPDTVREWIRHWRKGAERREQGGRPWPDNTEKKARALALLKDGVPRVHVAAEVGVAAVTITRWAREDGWGSALPADWPERIAALRLAFEAGEPAPAAAARLNISPGTAASRYNRWRTHQEQVA